jgi:CDP-glucose 4,6-dehydratase
VFHLAAQPIVRESYRSPRETYETNVMGTVNTLECVRRSAAISAVRPSVVNVTTDKVYENREWVWGYRENEVLNGYDPYSNSKSCSDLIAQSYVRSFFSQAGIPCSMAWASNVIGGGDFGADRIMPDCVRAAVEGKELVLRNPHSRRSYQHVLEVLLAYLLIAQKQLENPGVAGAYNVGPDPDDRFSTAELIQLFRAAYGAPGYRLEILPDAPHEANFLHLDCTKLHTELQWRPIIDTKQAVQLTADWVIAWQNGQNLQEFCLKQIAKRLDG